MDDEARLRGAGGTLRIEVEVHTPRGKQGAVLRLGEDPVALASRLAGTPVRAAATRSLVVGDEWTVRWVFRAPQAPLVVLPGLGALAPPEPGNSDGGPGPSSCSMHLATGVTLRQQVFLLVQRAEDGLIATVPALDGQDLPATDLCWGEDPHHAARRVARDWFYDPVPTPSLLDVQSSPPARGDRSWFLEAVYVSRLPPRHPVAALDRMHWATPAEALPNAHVPADTLLPAPLVPGVRQDAS